jgi:hypothetical protein
MTGPDRDLFGEPYYPRRPGYVRGVDTSHDAADSLKDTVLSRLRAQIFDWIDHRGEHGATCDEVEVELDLIHQTASARIRELVLMDRLYDTERRRLTRTNRLARVYCVKRRGLPP